MEGGRGGKGETEVLKQDAKKELRHSVLSRSDSVIESLDKRVGIEEKAMSLISPVNPGFKASGGWLTKL